MKIEHGTPVLFVCEKRSQIEFLAKAWQKHSPNTPFLAIACCSGSPGGFRMRLPRNLPISEVPAIYEPAWAVTALQVFDRNAEWQDMDGVDLIAGWAGQIVCACDPDPAGSYMFRNLLRLTRADLAEQHFPDLWLTDLTDTAIIGALENPGSTADDRRAGFLAMAEAKRFFDANWAVNALPVFSRPLQLVGVPFNQAYLSKYELQLLYRLRGAAPMSEGSILKLMSDWAGSGKYDRNGFHCGLGSAASRAAILENLKSKGLVDVFETQEVPIDEERFARLVALRIKAERDPRTVIRSRYAVTDRGRALLDRVHPKLQDPDLPFRIAEWGRGWPESRPQVERYIRTVFGRQKRFAPDRAKAEMPF